MPMLPLLAEPRGSGAGLMGTSLRGAGCGGAGGAAADSTAGGPILLHVAASRARGEGWESWGDRVISAENWEERLNETALIKGDA